MKIIQSNRLTAFILESAAVSKNTQRFDSAGFVFQVLLDNYIPFCATEPKNLWHPCTGGAGLCCEYSADYSGLSRAGEYFPKIGAGLLRREDDTDHIFYRRYSDFKPYQVECTFTNDTASFLTRPDPCCGIAVEQKKTVSVNDNVLTMSVQLKNVGERTIETREYCHNFLSLDGMSSTPDYKLELPHLKNLGNDVLTDCTGGKGCFKGIGKGLTFKEFTSVASLNNYGREFFEDNNPPFTFRMICGGCKASVTGAEDFLPDQISVWGVDHILSPEIMHDIKVEPGKEISWTRRWTFDA